MAARPDNDETKPGIATGCPVIGFKTGDPAADGAADGAAEEVLGVNKDGVFRPSRFSVGFIEDPSLALAGRGGSIIVIDVREV